LFQKKPITIGRFKPLSTPAVFIDRDGTLIIEREYLSDPSLVKLERNALSGVSLLAALKIPLVVVTNQSGIGRGYFKRADAEAVNRRVAELYRIKGVEFGGWYVCPHSPNDGCDCRKPKIGMAQVAKGDLDIDLARSVVIGDNRSDVEFAVNMGGRGVLVLTGHGKKHEDWALSAGYAVCADLFEAAKLVACWLSDARCGLRE
jgi:histidinol-phosphate phosphatase family protein